MAGDYQTTTVERCASVIPIILSYLILAVTWLGFNGAISIHTVLLKRQEFLHFFIQFIVFNGLFGMTSLSLFFASTRNPGQPNQALAPDDVLAPSGEVEKPKPQRRAKRDLRSDRPSPIALPPAGIDQDDIPLRYLRNSRWVNSRIGKDRPSPLPLRAGRAPRRRSPDQTSTYEEDSAIFPFVVGVNPLMPTRAEDAGEDVVVENDNAYDNDADGPRTRLKRYDDQEGPVAEDGVEERLLPGIGTRRRSVMAKSNNGGPRWCRKCEAWKPDRTHHCRYCKRCTLKMDHHCAWLGTCVGFHNYKPFLLFITYGTLLAMYSMLESGYESFRFFQDPDEFFSSSVAALERVNGTQTVTADTTEDMDPAPLIFLGLSLMGFVFALAVGSLTGYHWWLACNNLTTLENLSYSGPSVLLDHAKSSGRAGPAMPSAWKPDHLLSRDQRNRLRREARGINVYDLGWRQNIKAVFGDRSPFLALWPMFRAYRKNDMEAGHFFDIDDEKLARLTQLTIELRCGVTGAEDGYGSESDGSTIEDAPMAPDVDEPWTGTSGSRGDDELSEEGS